ncbi:hypothetical protein [Tranquillimonas alkanivorans]|uniref:Phage integrase family protein n=1 Tax=Tranquillimonas alkanivorans TaxID=441119 RepID=A0A1I5WP97_9RHOB|nr:hypothetical protein [Tranquillimonas alkanivorans]SFQ21530.1 hypothetical protein SAMN04488047_1524 [Tranquillimonas alkanivorans]
MIRGPESAPQQEVQAPTISIHDFDLDIQDFLKRHDLTVGLDTQDLDVLRYLSPELLHEAFEASRSVETLTRPTAMLRKSGTMKQYERAVRRLTEANRGGDPYAEYSMLTKTDAWKSRQSRSLAKAALNRSASSLILRELPSFYETLIHDARNQGQKNAGVEAKKLEGFLNHHYHDDGRPAREPALSLDDDGDAPLYDVDFLRRLARASKYLNQYPPDPHGIRSRKAMTRDRKKPSSPPEIPTIDELCTQRKLSKEDARIELDRILEYKKREFMDRGASEIDAQLEVDALIWQRKPAAVRVRKSKRDALRQVHELENRQIKRDPNYDWRSEFWSKVLTHKHMDDDRRAQIAVLMTTGCRPVELYNGVTVHLLKQKNTDGYYRLLLRIPGSKVADERYLLDDDGSPLKRTDDDNALIREWMTDPRYEDVRSFNQKGQAFRLLEIDAQQPEAIWLAQYMQEHGEVLDPAYRNLSKAETNAYREYDHQIALTKVIKLIHTPRDRDAWRMLDEQERRNTATSALSSQVASIGKKVFPKLRTKITSYVLRHAFSSDFKAMTPDRADRGAVMGHQSTLTHGRYGHSSAAKRKLTRSRASQIRSFKVCKPVRNPSHRYPGVTAVPKPGARP